MSNDLDDFDEKDFRVLNQLEMSGETDGDYDDGMDFDAIKEEMDKAEAEDAVEKEGEAPEEELNDTDPTSAKVYRLCKSGAPVVGSFFLSTSGQFTLLAFAGHIDEKGVALSKATIFAGIALTNLFCNVTFRSVIIGMSGAIDTLGSQNNGAKNYKEVGYVLQRSVFVAVVLCSCTSIWAWLFADKFFLWLGMDKDLCTVVGVYIKVRIFEMPFSCFNESYEKYLMAIGVMNGPMKANIALNLSVLCWCFIFMVLFKLGYAYLAVAWVLSVALASFVFVGASYHEEAVQRTLQPLNWGEILDYQKLYQFIELGVPGTLMMCSEWWAYEVVTVFAGFLGPAELGCMSIILQTCALLYMIPLGLSVATASLVGNALGAGKKKLAVQYGHIAINVIICIAMAAGIFIYFGSEYMFMLFTSDESILSVIDPVVPVIPLFFLFDCVQGVSAGVLRGAGQQYIGAVTNLISFYPVALPLAWALCFNAKLNVIGLMLGISCGTGLQSAATSFLIYFKENYVFRSQLAGMEAANGGEGDHGDVDEEAPRETSGNNSGWFGGLFGGDTKESLGLTLDYSKHDTGQIEMKNPVHGEDGGGGGEDDATDEDEEESALPTWGSGKKQNKNGSGGYAPVAKGYKEEKSAASS